MFFKRTTRSGVTMVELLLALSIMGMIGMATTSMMYSVGHGTSAQQDIRKIGIGQMVLSNRLDASIRSARQVLADGDDVVVLWLADTRNDGVPNISELRRIERNPDDEVMSFVAPLWLGDAAQVGIDTAYPLNSDFDTVTASLKGSANFPGEVWATNVVQFRTDHNGSIETSSMVHYEFTLCPETDGLSDKAVGSVRMRNAGGSVSCNVIEGTYRSETLTGTSACDVITAYGGHDTVYGNAGADFIIGGTGNDTMDGGQGGDTYIVEGGSQGWDSYVDSGGSAADRIIAAVTGTIIGMNGFNGSIEQINGNGLADVIVLDYYGSRTLDFRNTSLIDIAEVNANGGHDNIYVSDVSATNYTGGSGSDDFIIEDDFAALPTVTILDFASGYDDIDLRALNISYGDLTVSPAGNDTHIVLPNGRQIMLMNVHHSTIDSSDFRF